MGTPYCLMCYKMFFSHYILIFSRSKLCVGEVTQSDYLKAQGSEGVYGRKGLSRCGNREPRNELVESAVWNNITH